MKHLLSSLVALSTSLHAATWHVDPLNGDNANAGTEAAPLRSLAQVAKQVNAGDTVLAHAGVYFEHVKLECSGT